MKLVFCSSYGEIEGFLERGINVFELAGLDVYNLSEEELKNLKERIDKKELEIYSLNGLMGNCKPLREAPDLSEAKEYLGKLFSRLQYLGIKIAVFGSGGFRRVPEENADGFDEKLKEFVYMLSDVAKKYGVTIALEPLNSKECNIFTTAKECFSYVQKINRPEFNLLIDLYHFEKENEDPRDLEGYVSVLKHVHIAHPGDRFLPQASDEYDYSEFFDCLKEIGYEGAVSIEVIRNGFEGAEDSFKFTKTFL